MASSFFNRSMAEVLRVSYFNVRGIAEFKKGEKSLLFSKNLTWRTNLLCRLFFWQQTNQSYLCLRTKYTSGQEDFFSTTLPPFFYSSKMNIIAGDMNCVSSIHYDTLGHTRGEVLVGFSELDSLVTSFGCLDKYRKPPGALKYECTWCLGTVVLRQPADSTTFLLPEIVPLLLNLIFFHILLIRLS